MHKPEVELFTALVSALESAAMAEDMKLMIKNKAQQAGAKIFTVGLMDNVTSCPPEPIYCSDGVLDFIKSAPREIWMDLVMTICADTNMVIVGRSDIKSVLEKITDEDRAGLFGSVEAIEHEMLHHNHFNESLEKARNEGTHW